MQDKYEKKIQKLLELDAHGTRVVLASATELIQEFAAEDDFSRTELIRRVREVCRRLEASARGLRPIRSFCNDMVMILDLAPPEPDLRRKLNETCGKWDKLYSLRIQNQIVDNIYPLLVDAVSILIHGFNAPVRAVLKAIQEKKLNITAVQALSLQTEAGINVADYLTKLGVRIEVINDAVLARAVERVDAVLIGAGGISLEGVIGKPGTFSLALAAKHFGVPIIAVCDSSRLLPPSQKMKVKPIDRARMTARDGSRIQRIHVNYDLAELDLFTAFATERGTFDADAMKVLIEHLDQPKETTAAPAEGALEGEPSIESLPRPSDE